jgi:aminopeptidase
VFGPKDPRLERWAATICDWSVGVRPGDRVAIVGGVAASPLLLALNRETLRRGGHPVLRPILDEAENDLMLLGDDEQVAFVAPAERYAAEEADVRITVLAETNTRARSGIDPVRQRLHAAARGPLRQRGMARAAAGELRWSLTLFPTDAYAMDAEMATDEFAAFVLAACKLDQPDPAAAWRELSREQDRLIRWLERRSEVHLVGPGTDLRLSYAGRRWNNSDGKRNFPSGEIFTGPLEDSAEGHVRFSYPVVTQGREIDDVRLRFAAGRVADASAARNEAFLLQTLETDEGARRLGEFAFGTNFGIRRFTRNILFDEKIGGTVHLALGAGYPDTGSANTSAVHWDLICDLREGGLVTVDGEPFLSGGRYLPWG